MSPLRLPLTRALTLLAGLCSGVVFNESRSAEPVEGPAGWTRHGTFVTEIQNASEVGMAGAIRVLRQLPDGYLFVGTMEGAYLFDGNRWMRVPGAPRAFTLLETRSGELLLGSAGNVLVLQKHPVRGYEAVLRNRVRELEDPIAYLDETADGRLAGSFGPGLFFEDARGTARLLPIGSWIIGVACVKGGTVFALNQDHYQLAMVTGDGELRLNLDAAFADQLGGHHIVEVKPNNGQSCWAIADDGRTFAFDGETLTPAAWHQANPALRLTPRCIVTTPDGGHLVGSMQDGLFFFDVKGRQLARLHARNGLPEDTVVATTLDRDGSLWVATTRHLVRVDRQLRFLDFNSHQGLKVENSEVILRHRERLYVAGEEGLFVQNEGAMQPENAFQRVPGILTARAMVSDGETLWVGDNRLTAFHGDDPPVTYHTAGVSSLLLPSDRKDRLLCGTTTGLVVLEKRDGHWRVQQTLPTDGRVVYALGERKPGEYWGQLGSGRVARLRIEGDTLDLSFFGAEVGVPPRWIDLGLQGERLLIPGPIGSDYALEWAPESGRFVRSAYRDSWPDGVAPRIYHPVFYQPDGTALVRQNIRIANLVAPPSPVALAAVQQWSRRREGRASGVFWDDDGSLWICHEGGVMRCSGDLKETQTDEETLIVSLVADLRDGRPLAADLRRGQSLSLAPADNWLRVRAGLLDTRYGRFSQFRIWMEGFEPEPPNLRAAGKAAGRRSARAWSPVAEKDFTQLPSGDYRLHVQAVDGMGVRVQQLVIPVKIQTPWHQSVAARVGYTLAGVSVLCGLAYLRERRLKQRNHLLEEKVAGRTDELRRKNESLRKALDRVRRLAALSRESEERFRRMANDAPALIWIADPSGAWVFANESWGQVAGRETRDVLGEGWKQCIHEADLPTLMGRLEGARRDGSSLTLEHRLKRADGQERWVRLLARPLRATGPAAAGMIGIAVDITEVRQAHDERLSMARALEQAQRVESLRVLAGGVAHDFNNLLTAIMGYSSLLQAESGDMGWEQGSRMTDEILKAASKAGTLCRQMLAYAGTGQREEQVLDLCKLVQETATILRSQLGRGVTLEIGPDSTPLPILADEPQLQQLVTNLLTNASEAIDCGPGVIRIRTFCANTVQVLPGSLLLAPGLDDRGPLAVIEIADNGPGFTEEQLGRMFEPFFTTKGLGRGLGLSAVHGIVKAHRGYLLLKNEPGRGCTVSVALRLASGAVQPDEPCAGGETWHGSGRVLVVDDEAVVRESMAQMLGEMGFECVLADGGRAALELHAQNPRFELAVVDLVMPVCDGREVIDALARRDHGLPVLVVSGFTVTELNPVSEAAGSVAFLQKPFDLPVFRAAVRRLLESRQRCAHRENGAATG